MRKILFLLVLSGVPSCYAAIVPGPSTCTGAVIDTTGMSGLLVSVATWGTSAAGVTVTDSKGNTWHAGTDNAATNAHNAVWRAWDHGGSPLVVGPGHTVTVSAAAFESVCFMAFFGTQTSSDSLDQQAGNGANGVSSLLVNALTPSVANSLVLTTLSTYTTTPYTVNGSFVVLNSVNYNPGVTLGNAIAYWVQTTATVAGPTWAGTGSAEMAASIATFKSSGAVAAKRRGVIIQ